MILYLDASALVKRYVGEDGTDALVEAMLDSPEWSMCHVGLIETARAVGRAGQSSDVARLRRDWIHFDVVRVDDALVDRAIELGASTGLRTLDAMHLAAALLLDEEPTFATWDTRLHRAAREQGLRTLPQTLD